MRRARGVVRRILTGGLALLLLGATVPVRRAWADSVDDIVSRGELRVAVQSQGPPMSLLNKKGERVGAAVDLAKLMAEEMGVKLKMLDVDWDGLIPALLSKKVDFIAADMTPTLKRALRVTFTDAWLETGSVLFVKATHPAKSWREFNKEGVTIGAILGSTGETDAKKFLPKAKLMSFKGGGPVVVEAVLTGRVNAGINDDTSVVAQIGGYGGQLKMLPERLTVTPLAFTVRPEDVHLLQWMNLFFQWVKLDGRLDKIKQYWVFSNDWRKDHE